MSTEIKIVDSPINQAVSTLKGSAATFESDFPSEIKGENELELLEKFNHINQTYASLIQTRSEENSSHVSISYTVFCLKKKKEKNRGRRFKTTHPKPRQLTS